MNPTPAGGPSFGDNDSGGAGPTPTGVILTTARGREVLTDPKLNKGVAFEPEERRQLGIEGLLPPRVLTLEQQVRRTYEIFESQASDLSKNVFLTSLHDRNEVLFFRLLADHLTEMLPVVYTPTVGEAIMRYSHEYRRPHGVYLSVDAPDEIETRLRSTGKGPRDVDLIVATDGEAILGIGDWGVGGIEIAVGKLNVYTAAAGIDPSRTIPVMLDVGTNRQSLLEDPLYLGNQHRRVDVDAYDFFIDRYVETAHRLFPHAILHWEDIGAANSHRVLHRYRDRVLSFNDDIQGTAAVALAAVLSGARISGSRLSEQRIVLFGAGTAGIGIAEQLRSALVADGLSEDEASARIWCLDRFGLLTQDRPEVREMQAPFARSEADVTGWRWDEGIGGFPLAEVVGRVAPTVLIGASGQPAAFSEEIVKNMAAHVARPVILPLSNPTALAEASPADLLHWTDGRALVASGGPYGPVVHDGVSQEFSQANNALAFPGLALGALMAAASLITDGMLRAAAQVLADLAAEAEEGSPLLPAMANLRQTSVVVAVEVAHAAAADGVAGVTVDGSIEERVRAAMWDPHYRPVRAV